MSLCRYSKTSHLKNKCQPMAKHWSDKTWWNVSCRRLVIVGAVWIGLKKTGKAIGAGRESIHKDAKPLRIRNLLLRGGHCDPPLPFCPPSCYWVRAIPLYAEVKVYKNKLRVILTIYIFTLLIGKPKISSLNSHANFVEKKGKQIKLTFRTELLPLCHL